MERRRGRPDRRDSRRGGRRWTDPPPRRGCRGSAAAVMWLVAWSLLAGVALGGAGWLMLTAAWQWTP